jgi:Uma2 family endonuclease
MEAAGTTCRVLSSAMVNVARQRATYAEYMAFAETSELKHEFISGEIVAMAGGTIAHGRLIGQVTGLIRDALKGRPCVVLPAEVRVRIRAADRATYPDLHIVCGAVEADPDDPHAVVNPTVIVEVLSDRAAESHRGDKFAAYRRLRSLREYVLVSQHERRIDVYRRQEASWHLEDFGPGERLELASIGVALAVDDVYADALGAIVESRPMTRRA